MSAWARRTAVGLGVVALATTVLLATAPETVEPVVDPATIERALDETSAFATVAVIGLLAVSIGFWKGVTASLASPRPFAEAAEDRGRRATVAGDSFDDAVETARDGRPGRRRRAREEVDERLLEAAVDRVAAADGRDAAAARERVRSGSWTDDPVAASRLGDERAPDAPLSWRLYGWLYEDRAYDRSIERTVAAIERYGDGERP